MQITAQIINVIVCKQERDFFPCFYPGQGNAYMGNWVRDLRNYADRGITGIFQYALKDWTSIIFGTISHYQHNFNLFFERKKPLLA